MMCSDGGDVLEKASKRALGLRSQKKAEIIGRSRSKLRAATAANQGVEGTKEMEPIAEGVETTTTARKEDVV